MTPRSSEDDGQNQRRLLRNVFISNHWVSLQQEALVRDIAQLKLELKRNDGRFEGIKKRISNIRGVLETSSRSTRLLSHLDSETMSKLEEEAKREADKHYSTWAAKENLVAFHDTPKEAEGYESDDAAMSEQGSEHLSPPSTPNQQRERPDGSDPDNSFTTDSPSEGHFSGGGGDCSFETEDDDDMSAFHPLMLDNNLRAVDANHTPSDDGRMEGEGDCSFEMEDDDLAVRMSIKAIFSGFFEQSKATNANFLAILEPHYTTGIRDDVDGLMVLEELDPCNAFMLLTHSAFTGDVKLAKIEAGASLLWRVLATQMEVVAHAKAVKLAKAVALINSMHPSVRRMCSLSAVLRTFEISSTGAEYDASSYSRLLRSATNAKENNLNKQSWKNHAKFFLEQKMIFANAGFITFALRLASIISYEDMKDLLKDYKSFIAGFFPAGHPIESLRILEIMEYVLKPAIRGNEEQQTTARNLSKIMFDDLVDETRMDTFLAIESVPAEVLYADCTEDEIAHYVSINSKPYISEKDEDGEPTTMSDARRLIVSRILFALLHSVPCSQALFAGGLDLDDASRLSLGLLCMPPSKYRESEFDFLYGTKLYHGSLNQKVYIESKLEEDGPVDKILGDLRKNMAREGTIFVDLSSDRRNGETETLDLFSDYVAYFADDSDESWSWKRTDKNSEERD